ncbi:hypothetical protein D3C86_2189890 [compost metagenome]
MAVDGDHLDAILTVPPRRMPRRVPALQPGFALADTTGTDAHRQICLTAQLIEAADSLQAALG